MNILYVMSNATGTTYSRVRIQLDIATGPGFLIETDGVLGLCVQCMHCTPSMIHVSRRIVKELDYMLLEVTTPTTCAGLECMYVIA